MSKVARVSLYLLLVLTILHPPVPAAGAEEDAKDEDTGWSYDDGLQFHSESGLLKLAFKNWVQARLTVEDPDVGDSSESFDIPRFKIHLDLALDKQHLDGTFQIDFARGSQASEKLLEDAFIVYRRKRLAQFWAGQGKVFFGRQQLTSTADLQFIERSIASNFFVHNPANTDEAPDNRDVGVALVGENARKTYAYQVGLYNGNGINQDGKDNADYMVVARLVITPFGEFQPNETDLARAKESRLAVGISAQSVTLGTEAVNERLRTGTADLEVAFQYGGFNILAEFYTQSEDLPPLPGQEEDLTERDTDGWYIQSGYLFRSRWQVAGRVSQIVREVSDSDVTEYALGVNYYMQAIQGKIQLDARVIDFEVNEAVTPDIDTRALRAQFQLTF